jgi:hypothetical protein
MDKIVKKKKKKHRLFTLAWYVSTNLSRNLVSFPTATIKCDSYVHPSFIPTTKHVCLGPHFPHDGK